MNADMEQLWRAAFGQYQSLRDTAELQVSLVEWANGPLHALPPLFFERFGGRGWALDDAPPEQVNHWLYGFAAEENVLVEQAYNWYGVAEAFWTILGNETIVTRYSVAEPKIPLQIERLLTENGQPVRYNSLAVALGPDVKVTDPDKLLKLAQNAAMVSEIEETYTVVDGRVVEIHRVDETSGRQRYEKRITVAYDGAGEPLRIEAHDPTGTHLLYQRRPKGETREDVALRFLKTLVRAVNETLRGEKLAAEPVYAVILSYVAGGEPPPPALMVGRERDRQREPDAMWMPFMYDDAPEGGFLTWKGDGLAEAAQAFDQVLGEAVDDLEQRTLYAACRELNHQSWTGILTTTDDFVVFAVDYELDEPESAMRDSGVPQDRLDLLRQRGWLSGS